MSVEETLYSILTGDSAVSALVGTRVYPLVVADGASLPAISYFRVMTQRAHAMTVPTGVTTAVFSVEGWAQTYAQMRSLGNAIRRALDGWTGTVDGLPAAMRVENEMESYFHEVKEYRVQLMVEVTYQEA